MLALTTASYKTTLQHSALSVLALISLSGLSGCQLFKPNLSAQLPPSVSRPIFDIEGKIGVQSSQSGSAFYVWRQTQNTFDIELAGILGIGQTSIQGTPDKVTLSNQNGTWQGTNANDLLYRITGWQAPIDALPTWIMGQARPTDVISSTDSLARISVLQAEHWNVLFTYNNDSNLPSKLIMQSAGVPSQNLPATKVTLTISQRNSVN